jgi:hypothetical protein
MKPANERSTQRQRLLTLLRDHANEWVELPKIMAAGGAQYGARIYELRRLGHQIQNLQQADHSWFRLLTAPTQTRLLADLAPEPRYPD